MKGVIFLKGVFLFFFLNQCTILTTKVLINPRGPETWSNVD